MLHASLQELTTAFVQSLVASIRSMPISEINGDGGHETHSHSAREHTAPARAHAPRAVTASTKAAKAPKGVKGGRLARRTPEQIAEAVVSVVALVHKHPDGLRAEDIRNELGLDVREVPRVLKQGIEAGQLKIVSGQKRSTTYGVGRGGKASAKPKSAKKPVAHASAKKKAPKKAVAKAKAPKKAMAAKPKKTKKVTRQAHAPKAAMNGAGTHAAAATA